MTVIERLESYESSEWQFSEEYRRILGKFFSESNDCLNSILSFCSNDYPIASSPEAMTWAELILAQTCASPLEMSYAIAIQCGKCDIHVSSHGETPVPVWHDFSLETLLPSEMAASMLLYLEFEIKAHDRGYSRACLEGMIGQPRVDNVEQLFQGQEIIGNDRAMFTSMQGLVSRALKKTSAASPLRYEWILQTWNREFLRGLSHRWDAREETIAAIRSLEDHTFIPIPNCSQFIERCWGMSSEQNLYDKVDIDGLLNPGLQNRKVCMTQWIAALFLRSTKAIEEQNRLHLEEKDVAEATHEAELTKPWIVLTALQECLIGMGAPDDQRSHTEIPHLRKRPEFRRQSQLWLEIIAPYLKSIGQGSGGRRFLHYENRDLVNEVFEIGPILNELSVCDDADEHRTWSGSSWPLARLERDSCGTYRDVERR